MSRHRSARHMDYAYDYSDDESYGSYNETPNSPSLSSFFIYLIF